MVVAFAGCDVHLANGFEEGLGTDVINDGAIGRFMRPNVTFANRSFDETLRIPAPLLAQKKGGLAAQEISAVKSSKAQECGLPLAVTEVPDHGDALVVGHKVKNDNRQFRPFATYMR